MWTRTPLELETTQIGYVFDSSCNQIRFEFGHVSKSDTFFDSYFCTDSSGYIYDKEGITTEKLAYIMTLKNEKRARIRYRRIDVIVTETRPR